MYFEDPNCVDCDDACATCSGGTNTDCTGCDNYKLLINGECTDDTTCPEGQYLNETKDACLQCGEMCET